MCDLPFNPILFFKSQGKLTIEFPEDYFLLAFQTRYQLDMLRAFGGNVVCCDATHGTNVYGFYLVTLMIIDDFGEGVPVAWAICNHEDTCTLKVFFQSMKEKSGSIKPAVFMSDDANQYWNAWSDTFGGEGTKKLFCAWHVDRSWRKALREHVPDHADQATLYHHLKVLLGELDVPQFHVLLQQFMLILAMNHPDFFSYFQRTYVNRVEQWANCHRINLHINTNMYVESFHRLLKVVYLDGKQNRRIDHLLTVLLRIAREPVNHRNQRTTGTSEPPEPANHRNQ